MALVVEVRRRVTRPEKVVGKARAGKQVRARDAHGGSPQPVNGARLAGVDRGVRVPVRRRLMAHLHAAAGWR
jgi:hypothetical protein